MGFRASGLRDDGVMMQQQGTPGMCGVSEFQINILPKGVAVFTHLCNPHPASRGLLIPLSKALAWGLRFRDLGSEGRFIGQTAGCWL